MQRTDAPPPGCSLLPLPGQGCRSTLQTQIVFGSCWSPGLSGGRPDSGVTRSVPGDLPEPQWIILFVGASHVLLEDRCSDTGEPARFTMVTQHHLSATSDEKRVSCLPERDVHPQPTPTRLDLACSAPPSCAPRAGASPAEPAGSRPSSAGVPPEAAGPAGPAASPEPGVPGRPPRQPRPSRHRALPRFGPPCQGCHAAARSHQRRRPDRPPRPRRDHLAPARRMAPRAGLDDPVRSRLRARPPRRPDQPGTGHRPPRSQAAPGRPPAKIPGNDLWASRRNGERQENHPTANLKIRFSGPPRRKRSPESTQWIEA